jgi:NhaA family Na+:H+ antiporter
MAWGAVRMGWASLPKGVLWRHIWGAGMLSGHWLHHVAVYHAAGAGRESPGEAVAKLAILLASLVAGTTGFLLLRSTPKPIERKKRTSKPRQLLLCSARPFSPGG